MKRAIFDSGLTQRAIADEIGVDPGHLSRIVNGLHCNEATQAALARVLGLHITDIFGSDQAQDVAA